MNAAEPRGPDRERERLERLRTLEEQIEQALRDSEASGELRRAPSYGRPLAADDGFDETPAELRLPYKILKDAGLVPPEVQTMREITALQQALAACGDDADRAALRRQLADKRQHLALRLEAIGRSLGR